MPWVASKPKKIHHWPVPLERALACLRFRAQSHRPVFSDGAEGTEPAKPAGQACRVDRTPLAALARALALRQAGEPRHLVCSQPLPRFPAYSSSRRVLASCWSQQALRRRFKPGPQGPALGSRLGLACSKLQLRRILAEPLSDRGLFKGTCGDLKHEIDDFYLAGHDLEVV